MDLESVIEKFDTYAVDYVRYVVSLFGKNAFQRRAPLLEPKLFTFALISVLLGAFLNLKFVSGLAVGESDLATPVATEFSIWIALAVLVWIGVGLGRKVEAHFSPALRAVLRVLPVTFVVGAYVGYLLVNLAHIWTSPACAPWQAYVGIVAVRLGLIAFYMPLAVALIPDHVSRPRALAIGLTVAGVMLLIQAGSLAAFLVAQADKTCAHDGTCADPGAAHDQLIQSLRYVGGCLWPVA